MWKGRDGERGRDERREEIWREGRRREVIAHHVLISYIEEEISL